MAALEFQVCEAEQACRTGYDIYLYHEEAVLKYARELHGGDVGIEHMRSIREADPVKYDKLSRLMAV